MVDEFCHLDVIENRVRQDHPLFWLGLSHFFKKIFRFCLVVFTLFFNVPTGTFTQPCYKAFTNKKTALFLTVRNFNYLRSLFFLSCNSWLSRFRTFSSVFRTSLFTTAHSGGIQRTTNDVITYTRKVFYTTTTYKNN